MFVAEPAAAADVAVVVAAAAVADPVVALLDCRDSVHIPDRYQPWAALELTPHRLAQSCAQWMPMASCPTMDKHC